MIDLEKFPFENIREKQRKIIEKINENDEKKYVILNNYGYDLSIRAENLQLDVFIDLANGLYR